MELIFALLKWVNPFRAPKPLPIQTSSSFSPKTVPAVKALRPVFAGTGGGSSGCRGGGLVFARLRWWAVSPTVPVSVCVSRSKRIEKQWRRHCCH